MEFFSGAAEAIDISVIVTRVKSVEEVRSLPVGSVVGDTHGGLTFSDAIAAELEKRSYSGWRDIHSTLNKSRWTVIVVNR